MCDLKINEAKVTSRKAFTLNLFALNIEKNEKMKKVPSLETAPRFLACLLSDRPQMRSMCCFQDCFSFSNFLDSSCGLYNFKLSSLNSALIFIYKTNQISAV